MEMLGGLLKHHSQPANQPRTCLACPVALLNQKWNCVINGRACHSSLDGAKTLISLLPLILPSHLLWVRRQRRRGRSYPILMKLQFHGHILRTTTRKYNKTQLSCLGGHGSVVLSRKPISSVNEEYFRRACGLTAKFHSSLWSLADVKTS